VLDGYIVPHAPVLLLDHGYPDVVRCARRVRHAMSDLIRDEPDVVVIVSSHGAASGVYKNTRGSLDGFGLEGFSANHSGDAATATGLATAWGRPLIESPPDHGVVVPSLLLGQLGVPVVAVAIEEVTGPVDVPVQPAIEEAGALAAAVNATAGDRRWAMLLSAHTSAALSPRAPLLDRPAGHQLHDEVMHALRSNIGRLKDVDAQQWRAAGSCGVGPLTLAGRLWERRTAQVHVEESPAGVGYIVATIGGDLR
jgi:hypothetical protein